MMRRWRMMAIAVLVIAAITLACIGVLNCDWFRRHYAYYGDRIQIYAYEDGKILDTDAYSIDFIEEWYWDMPLEKNRWSYSLEGDYGTFWFILNWQGKSAEFFLENVNDWWRTNIHLHIDTNSDTVQQTNSVWNNDPAFADSFELKLEQAQSLQ